MSAVQVSCLPACSSACSSISPIFLAKCGHKNVMNIFMFPLTNPELRRHKNGRCLLRTGKEKKQKLPCLPRRRQVYTIQERNRHVQFAPYCNPNITAFVQTKIYSLHSRHQSCPAIVSVFTSDLALTVACIMQRHWFPSRHRLL